MKGTLSDRSWSHTACQAAHAASARISLRQSELVQLGGTRQLKIRFRQLPTTDGKGSSPIRVSPNERDGWVSRPKIYEEVVDEIGVLLSLRSEERRVGKEE